MKNIVTLILKIISILYLLFIPNYLSLILVCSCALLLLNTKFLNDFILEFKSKKDKSKYLLIPFVFISALLNDIFNYSPEFILYYRTLANLVLLIFSFQFSRTLITTLYITSKNSKNN